MGDRGFDASTYKMGLRCQKIIEIRALFLTSSLSQYSGDLARIDKFFQSSFFSVSLLTRDLFSDFLKETLVYGAKGS